jgi:hypothetical protein
MEELGVGSRKQEQEEEEEAGVGGRGTTAAKRLFFPGGVPKKA